MSKFDQTLTVKITDEIKEQFQKMVFEIDKPRSKTIRASLLLGMSLIKDRPELVDQYGGQED